MKTNQPAQGVMEQYSSETGRLLIGGSDLQLLHVVEFAGFEVPEGGLVLAPPFGGELTVWPDGQYAFTCPVSEDGGVSMVATHYSYVVEALDGTTTVGSFALGEQTPEEAMPDFQSWSMDDILALEDAVGLVVDLPGPVAELSDAAASGHVFSEPGLDLGGEFASDVLEHVIKTSCES
jgi:hypothetical protein